MMLKLPLELCMYFTLVVEAFLLLFPQNISFLEYSFIIVFSSIRFCIVELTV